MDLIKAADILIPKDADMTKWAVVSVDQFTSQRNYWKDLEDYVGDADSALKLVFPEVYLDDGDADERIEKINAGMCAYLEKGVFKTVKDSFVLVKRDTAFGNSTVGIMVAVDLEQYSFLPSDNARIRATEGFVPERIPPRLKIRENAALELPHIILLIDDRKAEFIEPFYANKEKYEKLYDFDLNMNGGHVEGYGIPAKEVLTAFEKFEKAVEGVYDVETDFIMAVGDGNHSLATAKTHWDKIKAGLSEDERQTHPARYALCELQNLHGEGLKFEPIYRCMFGVDEDDFVEYMETALKGHGELEMFSSTRSYTVPASSNSIKAIAAVQSAIDGYLKLHKEAWVDYIHGLNHLKEVTEEQDGVALVMPKIKKEELFGYILAKGPLCRKAFSMGEAEEKRYYLEAKRIKQ